MNNNDLKKIATGASVDSENFDACTSCASHTHISDLNIVSGECNVCSNPRKKYTAKQLEELLALDNMESRK